MGVRVFANDDNNDRAKHPPGNYFPYYDSILKHYENVKCEWETSQSQHSHEVAEGNFGADVNVDDH